jgi:hypothetical protein
MGDLVNVLRRTITNIFIKNLMQEINSVNEKTEAFIGRDIC